MSTAAAAANFAAPREPRQPEALSQLSSARNRAVRGALIAAAILCTAYGYGPDQDPFVLAWKQLAAEARAERWSQAAGALTALGPALAEIRSGLERDPEAELRRALDARDQAALARALLRAAHAAIALKFESSRREALADFYAAKYRVESGRSYYSELLAPAVRRRDQRAGTDLHARVWSRFDAARAALGRPGLLGRGAQPPDPAAFERAARALDADLREAFPFLEEVRR